MLRLHIQEIGPDIFCLGIKDTAPLTKFVTRYTTVKLRQLCGVVNPNYIRIRRNTISIYFDVRSVLASDFFNYQKKHKTFPPILFYHQPGISNSKLLLQVYFQIRIFVGLYLIFEKPYPIYYSK